jgi:hypothetical protein
MVSLCLAGRNIWFLLISLLLAFTLNRVVMALERSQDPCANFVMSGSEADYNTCFKLVQKAYQEKARGVVFPFNLSWLENPRLQVKFTNDVATGKKLPVTLAFDILPFLDGELAENMSISLGQTITKSPEFFLIQLQKHSSSMYLLGSLIGNLGPEYVDKLEKQILILKQRRAAVRTVINLSLEKIKKLVVKELSQEIKEREDMI